MRLYHGSNTAFGEVDLSVCRPNKDFGQGFYLAPDRIAAERMAKRTVRRFGGKAYLMTFDFDEAALADVPAKRFPQPSEEWAMFVMANRRPQAVATDHNRDNRYGMVVGPVANDDLALLFRQFALGLVTVEMLVREMQFKQLTIQYSFHTPLAVAELKFVGVDDVY
jgi:hypothetical protein